MVVDVRDDLPLVTIDKEKDGERWDRFKNKTGEGYHLGATLCAYVIHVDSMCTHLSIVSVNDTVKYNAEVRENALKKDAAARETALKKDAEARETALKKDVAARETAFRVESDKAFALALEYERTQYREMTRVNNATMSALDDSNALLRANAERCAGELSKMATCYAAYTWLKKTWSILMAIAWIAPQIALEYYLIRRGVDPNIINTIVGSTSMAGLRFVTDSSNMALNFMPWGIFLIFNTFVKLRGFHRWETTPVIVREYVHTPILQTPENKHTRVSARTNE